MRLEKFADNHILTVNNLRSCSFSSTRFVSIPKPYVRRLQCLRVSPGRFESDRNTDEPSDGASASISENGLKMEEQRTKEVIMFELCQVGENTYYINYPVKVGVYRANENEVYLIDSGNDKNAGRRIMKKVLDENKWKLKGIINTHSNADHIGGNAYLQQQTGCKIFTSGLEAAFTNYPVLEPSFLYGGYPFKEFRDKFLLAQPSNAVDIGDPDFPNELEIIPLPGHFFDMIGIRTPDDVVFLGDCVSSRAVLERYQICFIYDIAEYLDTLDKVETMEAAVFVPSHTEAVEDIRGLVSINREKVYTVSSRILSLLRTPMSFETLLKHLFTGFNIAMTYDQYALIGSTVRSYLAWLKDTEKISASFEENVLVWKTKKTDSKGSMKY